MTENNQVYTAICIFIQIYIDVGFRETMRMCRDVAGSEDCKGYMSRNLPTEQCPLYRDTTVHTHEQHYLLRLAVRFVQREVRCSCEILHTILNS